MISGKRDKGINRNLDIRRRGMWKVRRDEALRENIEVPALSSEAFCGKIWKKRRESPCGKRNGEDSN